jgi:hypothetical protein
MVQALLVLFAVMVRHAARLGAPAGKSDNGPGHAQALDHRLQRQPAAEGGSLFLLSAART